MSRTLHIVLNTHYAGTVLTAIPFADRYSFKPRAATCWLRGPNQEQEMSAGQIVNNKYDSLFTFIF